MHKADTVCPLRNELLGGNPERKVVITGSSVMMDEGKGSKGNPST